jgi:endonuclease-3 related protein
MPQLTELYAWYNALRTHYAGRMPQQREYSSVFERVLYALLGFGKAQVALDNLRSSLACAGEALGPEALSEMPDVTLAQALRPAGFSGNKVQKVRGLLKFLAQGVSFEDAFLRQKLVAIKGIGQESADAVLLHALDVSVFAVNVQTYRLLRRHGFVEEDAGYAQMQELFYSVLPEDTVVYKEYYHLIRQLAVDFCRAAKPLCGECPLKGFMEYVPDA